MSLNIRGKGADIRQSSGKIPSSLPLYKQEHTASLAMMFSRYVSLSNLHPCRRVAQKRRVSPLVRSAEK